MWDRRAQLVRIKDADTIVVRLDQGFRDSKEVDVRLAGVYCPEKGQPGYAECNQFTNDWFGQLPSASWPFVVTTLRMKTVDREQTTLERYVATVTNPDGTRNLNAELMQYVVVNGWPLGDR